MPSQSSAVQDNLPLKPVDLWILIVLCEGDRHGYGLVKEIERRTNGQLRLVPGNFYAMLGRLMDQGMITTSDRRSTESRGKSRRDYRITSLGRKVVSAEIDRLRQLVDLATSLRLGSS